MMQTSTRTKMVVVGLAMLGSIVALYAQEAQQINRPLAVTQGNVSISRGAVVSGGAVNRDYRPVTTVTDVDAHTYTTAELLSGYILRVGTIASNNFTDVLPTAANLIAAIPGVLTGSSFTVWIDMGTTPYAAMTLNGASTGVTYGGSCATAVDTNDVTQLLINITSSTTYRVSCLNANN